MINKISHFIFGLTVLLAAGCGHITVPDHTRSFVLFGTYLDVTSPERGAAAIVYKEFLRLGGIFNLYDPASELARLNATCDQPVTVSPEMIEVLELARQVYTMTHGAFDASAGALFKYWKDLIKKGSIDGFPGPAAVEKMKKLSGMDQIVIDKDRLTVTIKKKGLLIDLGGIAEGYMVDKAAQKLKEAGIHSALINAGGDIYCLGYNHGAPWSVGIKDPDSLEGILESEPLVNEAITTSGDYEQFVEYKGKKYSHLIDPRTGYPVDNGVDSVTVIAKNCVTSDALATAFAVMGERGIESFLKENPSTMRIFLISENNGKKNIRVFR